MGNLGAESRGCSVGQQDGARRDGKLGEHGPGEHVLQKIGLALRHDLF